MSTTIETIGLVLIGLGAIIFTTSGIGMLRLPDLYTRVSAVTSASGLGVAFIVVGALLQAPTVSDTVKVIVAVVLQLATSAVGGMALARSAYLTGSRLTATTRFDDLADHRDDDRYDPG